MDNTDVEIQNRQPKLNDMYAHDTPEKILTSDLKKEVDKLQNQLESYKGQVEKLQLFRKASFHSLSDDEFLYYKQILLSKGHLQLDMCGMFYMDTCIGSLM